MDQTGIAAPSVIEQLKQQDLRGDSGKKTSAPVLPKYEFQVEPYDSKAPDIQRLMLSNRVRSKELFGFLEIHPSAVEWYSNEGGFDETSGWLAGPVSDGLREIRLRGLGISNEQATQVLEPVPLESMNLVARDQKTGRIVPARKRRLAESFAAPFVLGMLFFMIVLLTSAPMLAAVAEDKIQRVFEMLLVSATPFDVIGGKVLAAVGTALTSSIFYMAGAVILLEAMTVIGLAPLRMVPWFFVYVVAEVVMLASVATALGAACNSSRDAENLRMITVLPVVIPILMMTAVLQDPNGILATAMSLFPLFTPMLMLIRQASPAGVPAWQPLVGIIGVFATTMGVCWVASRIFRVAILSQGKTPNFAELVRWSLTS